MEGLIQASVTRMPTQQLYEYLLVAHPDEEVNNKLKTEKRLFFETYKEKIAVATQPHLTIANFLATEAMEETLIRWMQRICREQRSFAVTLNNYSGFPPHTVYVRVQNELPFKKLAKALKVIDEYIRMNACPPAKFITKPHVSIARKLPAEVYEKAMRDYSQKLFHETFMVNELILLRRKYQFDSCKVINVFQLPAAEDLFAA
jgi:2'-5' RNA ligase